MKEKADEFKDLCIESIDRHVKNGGKIMFEDFGEIIAQNGKIALRHECGCAFSIALKGKDIPPRYRHVDDDEFQPHFLIEDIFSFSETLIDSFIKGFDGEGDEDCDAAFHQAGLQVRQHVLTHHLQSIRKER